MNVHFINLDRSKDRLAEFLAVNQHLAETTRIPAVEESTIDLDDLARRGLVKGDILSMYPIGGLCHAMSDLALWNKAIETGKYVTVADDDAIFNLNFDARAEEFIQSLPADWDLITWGFNFDLFMIFDMLPGVTPCVCQFDQAKMRLNTRTFQEMPIVPRAHKLIWAFGMNCYTVSPKGAAILKSKAFPLQPMLVPCPEGYRTPPHSYHYRNVGIDNTLNALHRHLNSYVCFPPLVVTKNESSRSTIQSHGTGTAAAVVNRPPESPVPPGKSDEVAALSAQAVELYQKGRFDEALGLFDKVLARSPSLVEAHYNRATILGDLNRLDEALAAYDKILLLKPDFVFALNNRGWILQKQGRYKEALSSYDRALAIDPGYAAAKSNREQLLKVVEGGN